MRIFGVCLMLLCFLWGCASGPSPDSAVRAVEPPADATPLEQGIESLELALDARARGDEQEARNAFVQASRHFREVDGQSREIMRKSLAELGKIVEISGFMYAPRESFEALTLYLKMQNAYIDCEPKVLSLLEQQFNERVVKAQEITVREKQ